MTPARPTRVVTRPLHRRLEGAVGTITITDVGEAATVRVNLSSPATVTCTGAGPRVHRTINVRRCPTTPIASARASRYRRPR